MRNWFFILSIIIGSFGCTKSDLIGPQCVNCSSDTLDLNIENKLVICNEGTFTWNNASLSLYDLENQTIQNNVYQTANNANALGDIAMDYQIINNLGYLVLNNSNKILVIDPNTFEKISEIKGIGTPRYIKQVSSSKAYVTSLFSEVIYVVDLEQNTKNDSILSGGWTEKLILQNGNAFICNRNLNQIQVIDVSSDEIIENLPTGVSPNSIIVDKNEKIWVLCDGGFEEENAVLHKINPTSLIIEENFIFADITDSPGNLEINQQGDRLYFLNKGVRSMSIEDSDVPETVLIEPDGRALYCLGVDPSTEDIFISDAKDYIQEGSIFRYTKDGNLVDEFSAGIIPSNFTFY